MKQPAISSLFHSQKHYDESKNGEFTLPAHTTIHSQDSKSILQKTDLKGNASKSVIELKVIETAASTKKDKNTRKKSVHKQPIEVEDKFDKTNVSPMQMKSQKASKADIASKKKTEEPKNTNHSQGTNLKNSKKHGKHKPSNAIQTLNFNELDDKVDKVIADETLSTASVMTTAVDSGRMQPRSRKRLLKGKLKSN